MNEWASHAEKSSIAAIFPHRLPQETSAASSLEGWLFEKFDRVYRFGRAFPL
jgi:hypothetical protein